jgi:hypothetical protein
MKTMLAVMTDQEMMRVMIRVIVVCAVACGLWMLIDFAIDKQPFNKFAKIILVVLAMIYLLNTLMRLG